VPVLAAAEPHRADRQKPGQRAGVLLLTMNKTSLLAAIVATLEHDLDVLTRQPRPPTKPPPPKRTSPRTSTTPWAWRRPIWPPARPGAPPRSARRC
jgi:hypothetical protein